MPKLSLTPENIAFIKANYLTMSGSDMANAISVSKGIVNRFQQKNGFTTPRSVFVAIRAEKQKLRTTATPGEDAFIKANYLVIPVTSMQRSIGRSSSFIIKRMKKLGLIIPEEIIKQRKLDSLIKPGNIPPNKGKKMDQEVYNRIKHTFFTKGHKPKNSLHDGAITIRHNHKERGSRTYKFIRLSEGVWEFLHRYNWMKENGPIPSGHMVVFKTPDTMNCDIENLKLISMHDNAIRNHLQDYPEEIIEVIQTRSLLNRTIKKMTENHG